MSEEFMKSFLIIVLAFFLLILGIPMFMMLFMGWGTPSGGGMMGGMMDMGMHMFNMFIPFWFFLLFFVVVLVGLIYLVTQKESRVSQTQVYNPPKHEVQTGDAEPDIFKVLRPDEKMVVDLLIKNGGKMLQKDLRWELGMNRVQIHRVLERLEERNIVSRKPVGNTNEVILADWIMEKYTRENREG